MPCGCGNTPPPSGGAPKRGRANNNAISMNSVNSINSGNSQATAISLVPPPKKFAARRVKPSPSSNASAAASVRTTRSQRGKVVDTLGTADVLAKVVFSDYDGPEKLSKLISESNKGSTLNAIMEHFQSNSITIHVKRMDPYTGAFNETVCAVKVGQADDNSCNLGNFNYINNEFIFTVTHGSEEKSSRMYNDEAKAPSNKEKMFTLQAIIMLLAQNPSPMEKYMCYWYIIKTFIASETIIELKMSDFKRQNAINNNSQTQSSRVFGMMNDNKRAFNMRNTNTFTVNTKNSASVLEALKKAAPNAPANKRNAQVNALTKQMNSLMSQSKSQTIPTGPNMAKNIASMHFAKGTLAPPSYMSRYATAPTEGGKTTKSKNKKKATSKK